MKKIMLIYSIPNSNKKIRVQFVRKLYDYRIKSHQGKYSYDTKGVLKDYKRPTNACIIFNEDKFKEVKDLCDKFSIKSKFFKVEEI
jgi:hypothetical protein